jgi:hypothetical protein
MPPTRALSIPPTGILTYFFVIIGLYSSFIRIYLHTTSPYLVQGAPESHPALLMEDPEGPV